jgi:hypothetical protein
VISTTISAQEVMDITLSIDSADEIINEILPPGSISDRWDEESITRLNIHDRDGNIAYSLLFPKNNAMLYFPEDGLNEEKNVYGGVVKIKTGLNRNNFIVSLIRMKNDPSDIHTKDIKKVYVATVITEDKQDIFILALRDGAPMPKVLEKF